MSDINNLLQITSAHQDLFIDLNDEKAETISGGYEVFTIKNNTRYNVGYNVDGRSWIHKPGEVWIWTSFRGGIIKFDQDGRSGVESYKKYNLANGGIYQFQDNRSTGGNPFDIELYDIG